MSNKKNVKDNLNRCCLYNELGSCSSYVSNRFDNWSSDAVNLNDLKDSAVGYLVELGVIAKSNQGSYEICESHLILNRLARCIDTEKPYLKICPLHRYTFGFGWKDSTYCAHIDHKNSKNEPRRKKRRKTFSTNNRIAPIHFFRHLVQFPYGGRLCGNHVKQVYSLIQTQESLADELNTRSEIHSYEIQANRSDELENVNTLLISLGQSPLKSQITTPLEEQTDGAIRRVVAKLRQAVSASALDLAKGIAPGQDKLLLQLANLHDVTERRPSINSISSDTLVDEQYLNYLIKMYESCKEKKFSYNEQVRILTLIPESWNFTNETIQEKFNCTIHAVKTARKLRKITDTPLHIDQKVLKIRQRIDSSKLDYFISWIIHSQLLISIPWGSTNMKLESGQIISLPQQMLQAQQSQIIYSYQQHCKIVGIDTLSDRTLYSILNSLNASEQKFITGLNEFVTSASEAWCSLEKIIRQLPISYTTKNDLYILLEKSKMYLKTKYGCECGETAQTTTHCTIFAMSELNNPFYSQSCNHDHNMYCEACLSVFVLFDQIEDYINTITDQEMKDEILYDFKMSWDSIFELMGHKIRATQQEQQKQQYINEMDETTAFLTIDWAQKILPQQFREGQSFEYGGGIKHLKIGVAEVTDIVPEVSFTSIPELTCIRNIIYQDENFLVRKATGVGLGKPITYEHFSISSNVKLVDSFERYELHEEYSTKMSTTKRSDRTLKT
ncbi:unnamed protein product, partial [Rotaria sordida]